MSAPWPAPPSVVVWLLTRCLPAGARGRVVLEELCEEFAERQRDEGRPAAVRWFSGLIFSLGVPYAVDRLRSRPLHRAPFGGRPPTRGGPASPWASGDDQMLAIFVHSLRNGLRSLVRYPGFSIAVVTTIALGIGANTAIFSVVDGVLLRPLPFEEPDELVFLWGRMEATEVSKAPFSGPDITDLRERSRQLESLAGVFIGNGSLTGDFETEQVRLGMVTPNFFSLLGVDPIVGRDFVPEDRVVINPGSFNDPDYEPPPAGAILGHGLWLRRFGGRADVVGEVVHLNGRPLHVIGVAPAAFRLYSPPDAPLPPEADLWTPIPADLTSGPRDSQWITVVARMIDGTTIDRLRDELDRIAATFREENPFHASVDMHIVASPMLEEVVGHARPYLLALLAAVGFVLLIACANVANLLLVRAHLRRTEVAVRAALGGSHRQIVVQILTESALLAGLGCALGLFLAQGGIRVLLALGPANLPRVEAVGLDGRVLVFAVGSAALAALLFGTAPALRAIRPDLVEVLENGARTVGSRGQQRLRKGITIAEVALTVALLVGAGLMLRSFIALQTTNAGFVAESVLTARINAPNFTYRGEDERIAFYRRLANRIAEIPGVRAVGAVEPLPLAGGGQLWFGPYAMEEGSDEWSSNEVDYRPTLPGYFETMRIPLLAGRTLAETDNNADAAPVVVIDEVLAGREWGDRSPVGDRILVGRRPPSGDDLEPYWAEVVGVVDHVRYDDLRADGRGAVYFPNRVWAFTGLTYAVLTDGDAVNWSQQLRDAVRDIDPEVAPASLVPMRAYVDEQLAPTRFVLLLLGVFAAVALLLALVGLYGVVMFSVRTRTREIGIRMAFGAGADRILGMALKEGFQMIAIGLAIGLGTAFYLSRWIENLVIGVAPTDALTFSVVAALVCLVATAACYLPSRRAASLDPVVALRAE